MAKGHLELLRDLFRPRLVKLGAGLTTGLFFYDALSNQFELPKLGRLLGMSGNLLPWWGWLLILQAILVYALFEYVRRAQAEQPIPREQLGRSFEVLADHVASVKADLEFAKDGKETLREAIQSFMGAGMSLTTELNERMLGQVEKLANEVHAIRVKQADIIEDYQRMLGLEAKVDDALANLRSDIGITRAELGKAEKIRAEQHAQIQSSFNALRAREHLERIVNPIIRRDAADLNRRHDAGEAFDADSLAKWENVHAHWFNAMCGWWYTARFYMDGCRDVLIAPDTAFAGEKVNESLFPDAESIRVFRKFRIIQRQWEAAQEGLDEKMRMVAFSGMSELEVRHGHPPEQGERPF